MSAEQRRGCLQNLAFIHIPKTAGLSLHHELKKHFVQSASVRFGNQEDRERFLNLYSDELKKYI